MCIEHASKLLTSCIVSGTYTGLMMGGAARWCRVHSGARPSQTARCQSRVISGTANTFFFREDGSNLSGNFGRCKKHSTLALIHSCLLGKRRHVIVATVPQAQASLLHSTTHVVGKFAAKNGGLAAAFAGSFPSMPSATPVVAFVESLGQCGLKVTVILVSLLRLIVTLNKHHLTARAGDSILFKLLKSN